MGNGKNNSGNSLFSQIDNRLQSIDIETSGLNEKKDFIWSMGKAGKGGTKEYFTKAPSEEKLEGLLTNDIFGIRGYHDEYKAAITAGKDLPLNQAINKLFSEVDKESIILVQNINFENKFIGEALRGGAGQNIKSLFPDAAYPDKGRILDTSKEITDLRHEAARSEMVLGRSTDPEARKNLVKTISSTYNKMIEQYQTEFRRKSGAVTVELMDISKAMYSLAAEKNQISSEHLSVGTTVDFLKKSLFAGTGAEKHTAAADAEDQIKLFNRMSELYKRLETNTLSGEDFKTFARIKAAHPYESSRQFISGLRNTLEEIKSSTIYDASGKEVKPGVTKIRKPEQPGYQSDETVSWTSSSKEARDNVVERYINRGTKGLDVEEFSEKMNGKTLDEQISFLKEQEDIFKGKVTRKLAGGKDIASDIKSSFTDFKYKKTAIGGLLAAGIYAMTSDSENDKIDYEEKKQEMMQARSNERTFSMFSKPEVYHGTGLHLWENAVRHHEY
ncbi:MAG: hypothetical protein DRQ78_05370 [Epsilonproteobacteria bacterium]|nr:MAG: hypothetical protein DRQ78_05370 [Campylobacterota bacterium]